MNSLLQKIVMTAIFAVSMATAAIAADNVAPTISNNNLTLSLGRDPQKRLAINIKYAEASDNVTPKNKLYYHFFVSSTKDALTYCIQNNYSPLNYKYTYMDMPIPYYRDGSAAAKDLEMNKTYFVCVVVEDEAGNKAAYKVTEFKTEDKTGPVASNKTVSVGEVTETTISISWTKATDNVTLQNKINYLIGWKKKSESVWKHDSDVLHRDINTYKISGLEPNTEYDIYVQSKDEAGNFGLDYIHTSAKTKSAADTQAPTVTNKKLTVTATTNSITVNWTKATDNTTEQKDLSYFVYVKSNSSTPGAQYHVSGRQKNINSYTSTTYRDGSAAAVALKPNTTYYVFVRVYDKDDKNFTQYDMATVKTQAEADTQAPTASNKTVTVGEVTETTISISWTKATDNITPQNKINYLIGWKKKSEGVWQHDDKILHPDINTYKISGLEPNTEYDIYVQSKDEAGNFGLDYIHTSAKTKAAADTEKPTLPTDKTLTVTGKTQNSVSLSWNKATDNATAQADLLYRIYVAKEKITGAWIQTIPNAKNRTSYTITSLEPNAKYVFRVVVEDAAGNYIAYTDKEVTTESATPTIVLVSSITVTPGNISATEFGQKQLTAAVSPANATNKSVKWESDNTDVATVDNNGLVTVKKTGTAHITATAQDGSGITDYCTITSTVGNESISGNKVWASGNTLYLSLNEPCKVDIYNLTGTQVKSFVAPAGQTNLTLPKGIYIISIGDNRTKAIIGKS